MYMYDYLTPYILVTRRCPPTHWRLQVSFDRARVYDCTKHLVKHPSYVSWLLSLQGKTQTIAGLEQQIGELRNTLNQQTTDLESTSEFQTKLSDKDRELQELNEEVCIIHKFR